MPSHDPAQLLLVFTNSDPLLAGLVFFVAAFVQFQYATARTARNVSQLQRRGLGY